MKHEASTKNARNWSLLCGFQRFPASEIAAIPGEVAEKASFHVYGPVPQKTGPVLRKSG